VPHTYGIMQGRLSPPEDNRFQSFPRGAWRDEFPRARAAGLDYIEWIHDAYGEGKDATGRVANPIFSDEGLAELQALKTEYNIATPALCGDWFMDVPLLRCSPAERTRREAHLHQLIPIAQRIGAHRIVLPFVRKPEGGIETLPLGTGSANFDDVFASMKKIGYDGGVTLQVARGVPGDEVDFIRTQLEFVRRYW
jgi:sugar phosphate isomerase/epimerase